MEQVSTTCTTQINGKLPQHQVLEFSICILAVEIEYDASGYSSL